ncbi:Histone H1.4 [Echinococcus granulosus]|uniref:Histone H1.4 n=1 Tax=Echinococcus granulosus TaxID=6210 RepID=W6V2W8_ECHGR|nr:Histone H1.4 [Echinococcus granulosus]EUB60334.1 Histone H1.4 [Echinococcus granulosus]
MPTSPPPRPPSSRFGMRTRMRCARHKESHLDLLIAPLKPLPQAAWRLSINSPSQPDFAPSSHRLPLSRKEENRFEECETRYGFAARGASEASRTTRVSVVHPPFVTMFVEAIASLKARRGSSRQAILKYIINHYWVEGRVAEVKVHCILVSVLPDGRLVCVKEHGASGLFQIT